VPKQTISLFPPSVLALAQIEGIDRHEPKTPHAQGESCGHRTAGGLLRVAPRCCFSSMAANLLLTKQAIMTIFPAGEIPSYNLQLL